MKKYSYFPGCSLEKLAHSYHNSSIECATRLGIEFKEIEDWNCCGATTYFHVDELLSYTLMARNLAIAEQSGMDFVAPCSACYKNAYFTTDHLNHDPDLADHINYALEEDNLHFNGDINVRHLIEIFCEDVGYKEIKNQVTHPLEGLRVAPYYGCQIVRPRKDHEDVEQPEFFEELISATGAVPIEYQTKMRCCGASLMMTSRDAALDLVRVLIQNAVDNEAMVIATACPLCQVNLECYQLQVNHEFGTEFSMPVLYFTQILGLALGIPPKKLEIGAELISPAEILTYAQEKGE